MVIYGSDAEATSEVARRTAAALPGRSAVASLTALRAAFVNVDADTGAELDLIHVQLRLLVANLLKNAYHVVVEGPFLYESAGKTFNYENDIDQLLALMRHMTTASLTVGLLNQGKYRPRTGTSSMSFEQREVDAGAIALAIVERLELNHASLQSF